MATFTGTVGDHALRETRQDEPSSDRAGARGGSAGSAPAHHPAAHPQVRSTAARVARPLLLLASGLLALAQIGGLALPTAAASADSPAGTADDQDGIGASDDICIATPAGAQVDAAGCSIAQLCPCRPESDGWQNHAAYLACVAQAAQQFIDLGLIATPEQGAILARADRSRCGKRS